MCEPPPHRIGWHEVDERLLAVDLDDREQLAVARLELGVAVDRISSSSKPSSSRSAETVSRARSQRWQPSAP